MTALATPTASGPPSSAAATPRKALSVENGQVQQRPNENIHFSHTAANGRQDVMALKQQLADALGENGPLYWDALRDFVMGRLNRQEFDFYANLYLSRQHAHLHNAFILSTIHNAQSATPPPSKQRTVGWAKRKRGKDGVFDLDQDQDPRKKKLKMDVMSLPKTERDRLKTSTKARLRPISNDKNQLRPFVDRLLGPRVGRTPALPLAADQLYPNFNSDYSRGVLAPLCSDLKELPSAETLHSRMSSIALEHGLFGGVTEDAVHAMLFAMESYIKSAISSTIMKRRVNRPIGPKLSTTHSPSSSQQQQQQQQQRNNTSTTIDKSIVAISNADTDADPRRPCESLRLRDLAFSFQLTPYVLVENPLNGERLTSLMVESENEVTDDELEESSSEGEFEL
ncbi:hypothetical protein DFQ28_008384 [Apophysomyces sp. BC1034]|nr:hypothetical protein DFQ30_008089 [Apophysomyces sp. BC1015]KAG0178462.1 hypothetical protein DFQ29_003439 [Apophysomyces sp. BC1021]KAG0186052.1 hypothetical protein DFQ28_008384 [Apophysomyces sp. BC1034]